MWFEKGRGKKKFFWLVSIVKNWSLGLLRAFSRPQLQFFVTWTSWLVSFTAINWSYHATSFHPSPKKKAWCEMRPNNGYEGDDSMTHILQNIKKKGQWNIFDDWWRQKSKSSDIWQFTDISFNSMLFLKVNLKIYHIIWWRERS